MHPGGVRSDRVSAGTGTHPTERLEYVQDAREAETPAGDRALSAWGLASARPAEGIDVAVLLLDTRHGLVTYANPAALALTGARARLPVRASAAGLA